MPSLLGHAYALHLIGDHAAAEAESGERTNAFVSGGADHARHLLFALTAAAQGRWDDAARALAARPPACAATGIR